MMGSFVAKRQMTDDREQKTDDSRQMTDVRTAKLFVAGYWL
jgi:hypothetical protein